jgi:G3E family GTPase
VRNWFPKFCFIFNLYRYNEERPEGQENEAIEQVAFADRMILNKTDLVKEEDLVRVEKKLKVGGLYTLI